MNETTRRQTIKLLAGAAAGAIVPCEFAAAENVAPPSGPLAGQITKAIEAFTANEAEGLLKGDYARIFKRTLSTQAIERVAHVNFTKFDEDAGQRFIWNFEPQEYALGFNMVADDDPRVGKDGFVRAAELPIYLKALTTSIKTLREVDAANILNGAAVYDPRVGGDGVAVCSNRHPCLDRWPDFSTWSNLVEAELTPKSLETALAHIQASWVDQQNLRISAHGRRLIVPVTLAASAKGVVASVDRERFPWFNPEPIVWDYLQNGRYSGRNWFIQTTVDGLTWFERRPFAINFEFDHNADCYVIAASERRIFGCSDPRAVLGAFPT